LIASGLPDDKVAELTGLCDKSVGKLKDSLENGETESIFHVGGGGRKSKLADVEGSIIEEINKNNYHSRKQIADMIYEKHGIRVSLPAIGRILKKRNQAVEMRLAARESGSCKATRFLRRRTQAAYGSG
jgi:transposase